ncbi:hypothetical protein BSKO_05448 [Bryopsis sp. KO-2023]|nr:hypothetical protein BSKO_05448 [Bryopsis sp. KO-2023]
MESNDAGLRSVAAPSDRFSKIFEHGNGLIAKSGRGSGVPRPCQHLARHVQAYLQVLDRIESEGALPRASFDVEQILEEVELWMGRAEDLVVRLCPMKSFYCLVRAHSISGEVREICGKLAATVRSLRKLLVHPDESLIQSLQLDMRHLRIRISKINFRVREEVDRFFEKMRKTVGRMYNKHVDQKKGRLVMERMMERVMQRRLSDMDLGEAPRLLHQDLYRARMNKDEIEEHYINQILALTTPDAAPPEYQCPISKEIMEEPVILFETGVIYDKKEIDKWFNEYGEFTCPVSRKELSSKAYVEVRSLKSLIQDWKRAKSEPLSDIEDDESTASALESLGSPSGFDIWQAAPETDSMSDFDVYSTTSIPETSASQKTVAGFLRAGIGYFLRSQPRLTQEELFYEPEDLQTAVSGSSNGEPTAIETPGGGRRRTNQDDMKKIKKAVIDNDLELLREMHADGLDMDKPDRKHGATPLHYATEMGHQDILEFVLSTGARVNAQTHDSYAPLHFAVAQGSIDSVRILLEAHACVDLQAEGGWTPLHLSQNSNNIEIGNLLLEAGADPNITLLQDGLTPLHRAAFQHHTAFAELLLSHPKIAVDQLTQTSSESTGGRSAADIAASRGYVELYRMIKKRGNSRRRLQT